MRPINYQIILDVLEEKRANIEACIHAVKWVMQGDAASQAKGDRAPRRAGKVHAQRAAKPATAAPKAPAAAQWPPCLMCSQPAKKTTACRGCKEKGCGKCVRYGWCAPCKDKKDEPAPAPAPTAAKNGKPSKPTSINEGEGSLKCEFCGTEGLKAVAGCQSCGKKGCLKKCMPRATLYCADCKKLP